MNPTPVLSQDTTHLDRNTVLLVAHGIVHGPSCGERIPCPICGDGPWAPYMPAERQSRRTGTFVLCHACDGRWREIAA